MIKNLSEKAVAFFLAIAAAIALLPQFYCFTVSAEEVSYSIKSSGDIPFNIDVTDCTGGENNGIIRITPEENMGEYFFYSFNGGKSFTKTEKTSVCFYAAENKCYSVCLKDSKGNVSETVTFYVGSDDTDYAVRISAASSPEKIYKDGTISVTVANYNKNKTYEASLNGGKTWLEFSGKRANLNGLEEGTYNVTVREKGKKKKVSAVLSVNVSGTELKGKKYIKTEELFQLPELPTGCEVTSLTMLLNYLGFNVSKTILADNYLPKGAYRASDCSKVFVGNPRSTFAYGCFAGVIEQTANAYLAKYDKKNEYTVRNITGCKVKTLYAEVDNGNPVIVWASIDMGELKENSKSWIDKETGQTVTWTSGEHCVLLTGYDNEKNLVYVNDPLNGIVAYNKDLFELRFAQMKNNAVIITKNTKN